MFENPLVAYWVLAEAFAYSCEDLENLKRLLNIQLIQNKIRFQVCIYPCLDDVEAYDDLGDLVVPGLEVHSNVAVDLVIDPGCCWGIP